MQLCYTYGTGGRTVPEYFSVAGGVGYLLARDGERAGDRVRVTDEVTRKRSVFGESEVLVDPDGKVGRWGPQSSTLGGDYARRGFYAFKRESHPAVMIVPGEAVERTTLTRCVPEGGGG
jgi:hypothetical protein